MSNIDWPKNINGSGWRIPFFNAIIPHLKPKTYCEIGCHNGKTSGTILKHCLEYVDSIHFTGYDLFDLATEETQIREINGKGIATYDKMIKNLSKLNRWANNLNKTCTYELHKGFTVNTLKPATYDLVFIDGGHSYDTVMFDYEQVKNSKIIFFDDYDLDPVKKACDEIGAINLVTWPSKKKLAIKINF